MRKLLKLVVAVALIATCGGAREVAVPAPVPVPVRDRAQEEVVAQLLEKIRADAKLPALTRIKHRASLEQRVCTFSDGGATPKYHSPEVFALYTTAHPEMITPELTSVASSNVKNADGHLAYPRYSVAVWKIADAQSGAPTYWVGVERYWNALFEFVDDHLTDDVFYHNMWKQNIAPDCRGK
jgi:hypothetical protein